MEIRQQIYAELESRSQPATLPGPWSGIAAPPAYRAPLGDHRAIAKFLLGKYQVSDLVSAGVFLSRPGGQGSSPRLLINAHLLLDSWLILRRAVGDPPSEIVTSQGCLSGNLPVLASLEDATFRNLLVENCRELFAATSLADAMILLSLGWPAIPASGLDDLRGTTLDRFCREFDVRPINSYWLNVADEEDEPDEGTAVEPPQEQVSGPASVSDDDGGNSPEGHPDSGATGQAAPAPYTFEDSEESFSLTFVGCQLSALSSEQPAELARVSSCLADIADNLDLLLDQVHVWRPKDSLLAKLRWALDRGSTRRHLQYLCAASHAENTKSLFPQRAASPQSPVMLPEALLDLRNAGPEASTQLKIVNRIVGEQIVQPLLVRAAALDDPEAKARAVTEALSVGHGLDTLTKSIPVGGSPPPEPLGSVRRRRPTGPGRQPG